MKLDYEKKYFQEKYLSVAGTDEVGRGPLAGPVVAACVLVRTEDIERIDEELFKINDSKKLSGKKRDYFFDKIKDSLVYGIGVCDQKVIDEINILQASFLAMKKAITVLKEKPQLVLVDGSLQIPSLNIKQESIIKGDSKVFSIAAASIIAKVTRDRMMFDYDKKYPGYEFSKHKGYGTKVHLEAIKKYGASPIHRLSFAPFKK